jgi:hypothetical protein
LKLAQNEEYLRDAAEHFSTAMGEEITPQQIREMIQNQTQRFSDKGFIQNTFVEDLLINVDLIANEFVSKPWQIWEAPTECEFVTSDNPLVTFLRLSDEVWHPGHGFRTPNVIVAFPLAPTSCLTMGIIGREFQKVDQATVMRLNEIIIRSSDRFVYSKSRSDCIAEMVEEIGRTSVPGESAFIGRPPDENLVEEHMRKTLGIKKRAIAGR